MSNLIQAFMKAVMTLMKPETEMELEENLWPDINVHPE